MFSTGFFEGVVGVGQALGQGGGRNVRDYLSKTMRKREEGKGGRNQENKRKGEKRERKIAERRRKKEPRRRERKKRNGKKGRKAGERGRNN